MDPVIKKTPLLVQPGQGDGESHLGITNTSRQRHIWCTSSEIDDRVFPNTYFKNLIPTLALYGSGDGDYPSQELSHGQAGGFFSAMRFSSSSFLRSP